jgi:hypothetical protein
MRQQPLLVPVPQGEPLRHASPHRVGLASARRWLHARDLLVFVALALLVGACKSEGHITAEQAERGLGLPDTSSDGTRIKLDARCPANQTVNKAEPNTPEFVLLELLTAASSDGDEAANFQRFASHFPPETEVKWIRDQYWSRAKKFVTKYLVPDSEGVTFRICERRENKQNGELKLFIQSFDPQKSNPPITVKKDDAGVWKVVFYTP